MEKESGMKSIEQHPYKSTRECPDPEDRLIGDLCVPPSGPDFYVRWGLGFPDGEDFRELKKELQQFVQRTVRRINLSDKSRGMDHVD